MTTQVLSEPPERRLTNGDAQMNRQQESPTPLRVLLVEDDPGDALLAREMLSSGGTAGSAVELTHASNIAGAIALLLRQPQQCVLLDLHLPDAHQLDGLTQVLAAVPEVPVVVLTGTPDPELATEAMECGAQDFLTKEEVNRVALWRAIDRAIARARAARGPVDSQPRIEPRIYMEWSL